MTHRGILYRLKTGVHGIKEKESGLLPTPTSGMYKQDVMDSGEYARKIEKKGHQIMLPAAIKLKQTFPTPRTQMTRPVKIREGGHRSNLEEVVAERMFPTPNTMDHLPPMSKEKRLNHPSRPNRKTSGNLREEVIYRMFPTPQASDYQEKPTSKSWKAKGGVNYCLSNPEIQEQWKKFPTPTGSDHKGWSRNHKRANDPTNRLDFRVEPETGVGGTLNPEWVCWLMGYPPNWLDVGTENQTSPESQQVSKTESINCEDSETP